MLFLSTPSARRATYVNYNAASNYNGFLSTPSARRATHVHGLSIKELAISIHALREEGDAVRATARTAGCYFYPRPPRGGRRCKFTYIFDAGRFLSTPSARRATIHLIASDGNGGDFYPRPPRGGRRMAAFSAGEIALFLSTPSARRATGALPSSAALVTYFYPRPPRGGRLLFT